MEAEVLELEPTFAELQARGTLTQDPLVPTDNVGATAISSISSGSSGIGASVVGGVATLVSPLTAKGDLFTRSAAAGTRLPVAANDARLTTDSAETTGLKWVPASTGWAAWTGTATRSSKATYSGTASVGYVQGELQGVMDKLKEITEAYKALVDDLLTQKVLKA